ncbi:MAG: ribonuclease domain-containing protein [Lysobacteraceae bacterium]
MRSSKMWIVALLLLAAWFCWQYQPQHPTRTAAATSGIPVEATHAALPSARTAALPAFLPAEAGDTLRLIAHGGPFAHRQDGGVFSNREGHLPQMPRGYYHEYTVDTPGAGNRGTRRIITGGDPPVAYYYTDDHYDSFRSFEVTR